jgi:hypothetical protein
MFDPLQLVLVEVKTIFSLVAGIVEPLNTIGGDLKDEHVTHTKMSHTSAYVYPFWQCNVNIFFDAALQNVASSTVEVQNGFFSGLGYLV